MLIGNKKSQLVMLFGLTGSYKFILNLDSPTLRVEGLVLTEDEKNQIKMALDRMHAEKILSDGLNSKDKSNS
jgi:hypothetical protein